MSAINKVELTGNLGATPEVKTFENGRKMARFSMATKEEFTTHKGERGSDVQWHYVVAWGKVADKIEAELQKGSYITISGRIVTRSYVDKSGVKRYHTEIVANDVILYKKA